MNLLKLQFKKYIIYLILFNVVISKNVDITIDYFIDYFKEIGINSFYGYNEILKETNIKNIYGFTADEDFPSKSYKEFAKLTINSLREEDEFIYIIYGYIYNSLFTYNFSEKYIIFLLKSIKTGIYNMKYHLFPEETKKLLNFE